MLIFLLEEEQSRIIILWMITHEPCTSAGIINLDGIQMKGAFAKKADSTTESL